MIFRLKILVGLLKRGEEEGHLTRGAMSIYWKSADSVEPPESNSSLTVGRLQQLLSFTLRAVFEQAVNDLTSIVRSDAPRNHF